MRWDPLLASATARELDAALHGARLQALLADPETRRLVLFLRTGTLVLELHPLRGWLSLLPAREPPPEARRLTHTIGGIEAPPDESMLTFQLRRDRGRGAGLELVVELIGNRWNALVVDRASRVIRHALVPREDRHRSLTVGAAYEPPPPTERSGVDREMDEIAWDELLSPAGGDGAGAPGDASDDDEARRRKLILRRVAWTSSINVDALLGPDGWRTWRRMTDPSSWGAFLLSTASGFQPYPVALGPATPGGDGAPHVDAESFANLLEALRAGRERDPEAEPTEALLLSPRLVGRARARLDQAEKRVAALQRELSHADDPAPVRALGDLVLARLREVPRGATEATLSGFDGEQVVVELDPTLSPSDNAARYYERAGRLERARESLPQKIERAEREARRWRETIVGVIEGSIPQEALSQALGPERSARRGRRAGQGVSLPYRSYRSSGGLEIRVGRGAKQNDELTFHHAAPMDVWLHVRQSPGAHVILRWTGEDRPPRRDLAEAASLAALHSGARHAGSVPVAWTRRKYVRKPKGAAAGTVAPERVETVFVTPDPSLLQRLRPSDDGADAT